MAFSVSDLKEEALATGFQVYLPGTSLITKSPFRHCSGLITQVEVESLASGGSFTPLSARGGRVLHLVTLSQGASSKGSKELLNWIEETKNNAKVLTKKTVAIYLEHAATGIPITGWRLVQAWPTGWSLAALDQTHHGAPALEEVTFAFDAIETIRL